MADQHLRGKTVCITGAGSGLGAALAELLAAPGAAIVAADIDAGEAQAIAAKRAWPNAAACHASKWGRLGLSHALHAELRPHRIKVTAVIAGGMRTPFPLDRFPDIDLATLQEPMRVAQAVKPVLLPPDASVVAEITVLPLGETSWP